MSDMLLVFCGLVWFLFSSFFVLLVIDDDDRKCIVFLLLMFIGGGLLIYQKNAENTRMKERILALQLKSELTLEEKKEVIELAYDRQTELSPNWGPFF